MNTEKLLNGTALLLAAAWAGGMWSVGYLAAPVLFQTIPDKTLAGLVAGRMFTAMAYAGVVCALALLALQYWKHRQRVLRQWLFWLILLMLGITLLGQFGIQPLLAGLKEQALPLPVMQSEYAGQFRMWHGVSSVMFLLESLLAGVMLLRLHAPELQPQKSP